MNWLLEKPWCLVLCGEGVGMEAVGMETVGMEEVARWMCSCFDSFLISFMFLL